MRKEEWRRLRDCTNKHAYATRFYAECYAANVLGRDDANVYRCGFCGEFHLSFADGPVRVPDAKRPRQKNKARR